MNSERARWRERLTGAAWLGVAALWPLAGWLVGDPTRIVFPAVMTSTLLTVTITLNYAHRRVQIRRIDRLESTVKALTALTAQREEAWHAINALLDPTSEQDNVRRLSRTGPS